MKNAIESSTRSDAGKLFMIGKLILNIARLANMPTRNMLSPFKMFEMFSGILFCEKCFGL